MLNIPYFSYRISMKFSDTRVALDVLFGHCLRFTCYIGDYEHSINKSELKSSKQAVSTVFQCEFLKYLS